jgi:hypothetical protein
MGLWLAWLADLVLLPRHARAEYFDASSLKQIPANE